MKYSLARTTVAAGMSLMTLVPSAGAVEPLDTGPAERDLAALRSWPGLSFGWDIHAEVTSLFKRYTIGDQNAWYSGQGAGGGASASLHFRPAAALNQGNLRWV